MDARGHGDSDWDPQGDYDIHRMAEDLEEIVAQRFPDRRPVIVGASLGGLTAMVALGHGKDVARALVLVDVTPKIEVEGVQRIGDFMRSGFNGFASLEEAAEAIAAYQPHRRRPPTLDGLRKNLRLREDGRWHWHWDPEFAGGASADNAEIGNAFFEELVPRIQTPTLLIRGSATSPSVTYGSCSRTRTRWRWPTPATWSPGTTTRCSWISSGGSSPRWWALRPRQGCRGNNPGPWALTLDTPPHTRMGIDGCASRVVARTGCP